ncbi:MAG TPA: hypothetical protein VHX86_18745 [Tepidisphaeraceae bacterium]|nr:hypothetical protein [Tepidisphaeraceae bacterium]
MRREAPIVQLLAGISLILFLGLSAIWARSYSKAEDLVYYGRSVSGAVHDAKGRLAFVFTNAMWSNPHFEYSSSAPAPGLDYANPPHGSHTSWNRLGFYFSRSARLRGSTPQDNMLPPGMSLPPVVRFTEFVVPFWALLLLLALPPFWNYVLPLVRGARRPPGEDHRSDLTRNVVGGMLARAVSPPNQ